MIADRTTVRIKTARGSADVARPTFVAFVTLAGTADEVRVRFTRKGRGGEQWKCDTHGGHQFSTCAHEKAAVRTYRQLGTAA